MRIHYRLNGNTLTIRYDIKNTCDTTLPCSIGAHPAFNWPQAGNNDKSSYHILFSENEPVPLRRLESGLLKQEQFPSPIDTNKLALKDTLFEDDALIFTEHQSRKLTLVADGACSITVDFEDFPHLGIWTKPGADFICIEPWQGHSDPVDFNGDFMDKPGVVHIEPGESRKWTMHITIDNK